MRSTRVIPDTTYLSLLGDKKFRFFYQLREYAENLMQMGLWYVDNKSRRGNYYLYFDNEHNSIEKAKIVDKTVLTFAISEYVLNCEVKVAANVWRKIVNNMESFSDTTQKGIQYDVDNSSDELKEYWIGVQVRNQQTCDDVMKVLTWQREYAEVERKG